MTTTTPKETREAFETFCLKHGFAYMHEICGFSFYPSYSRATAFKVWQAALSHTEQGSDRMREALEVEDWGVYLDGCCQAICSSRNHAEMNAEEYPTSVIKPHSYTAASVEAALAISAVPAQGGKSDCGHGWVHPRADGVKARCGGPGLCNLCKKDQDSATKPAEPSEKVLKVPSLQPVITWLENGCNVDDAISELKIYQSAIEVLKRSAPAADEVKVPENQGKSLQDRVCEALLNELCEQCRPERKCCGIGHADCYNKPADPDADEVKVPDVAWLSNVIRSADGNNTLGAGALAEKIVEAMLAAPKKQET